MQNGSTLRSYIEGIIAQNVQAFTSISRRLNTQLNYVVEQTPVTATDQTRLHAAIVSMITDAVNVVEDRVFFDDVTFAAGVADGEPVYWDDGNSWFDKALDDGSVTSRVVGLADVTASEVTIYGKHTAGIAGLTLGKPYYLSTATAGTMTNAVRPNAPRLGFAKSANELFVNLTNTGTRLRLTSDIIIYVAPAGDDIANDGLTIGTPFATIGRALELLYTDYDLAGFAATIKLADGTYSEAIIVDRPFVGGMSNSWLGGAQPITLAGNNASPANVIIDGAVSYDGFRASGPVNVTIKDLTLAGMSGGHCINATHGASVVCDNIRFGLTDKAHIAVSHSANVTLTSYEIFGNALYHWSVTQGGSLNCSNTTVTVSAAVAFTNAFAYAQSVGIITAYTVTFVNPGNATGTRYDARLNSVIDANGAGATYFPGSVAGVAATGGQYA